MRTRVTTWSSKWSCFSICYLSFVCTKSNERGVEGKTIKTWMTNCITAAKTQTWYKVSVLLKVRTPMYLKVQAAWTVTVRIGLYLWQWECASNQMIRWELGDLRGLVQHHDQKCEEVASLKQLPWDRSHSSNWTPSQYNYWGGRMKFVI